MNTSKTLTRKEADALGRELDELRQEVMARLGQADVDHIRSVIRAARYAEASGRLLLHMGLGPVSFAGGVGALAVAKILENMEIGHNVMHGQYDWTKDPELDSRSYEWDIVCPSAGWRHMHNYEHHTFTNIVGKDRDVGYAVLRISSEQPWHPGFALQPLTALGLAFVFQWGVSAHCLGVPEVLAGKQSVAELRVRTLPFLAKAASQVARDYAFYPAIALWNAPRVLAGNLLANMARNLWAFAIIFCGHFPAGVRVYREEEVRGESRGQWYVRQMNGSANIEGGRLLHILSGHLSYQIEHHLFPDMPAARYGEIAPRVREICQRYGQTYATGSLVKQFGSVIRQIFRHALPERHAPRDRNDLRIPASLLDGLRRGAAGARAAL